MVIFEIGKPILSGSIAASQRHINEYLEWNIFTVGSLIVSGMNESPSLEIHRTLITLTRGFPDVAPVDIMIIILHALQKIYL